MLTLQSDDPLAIELCHVIRSGDIEQLIAGEGAAVLLGAADCPA